MNDKCTRCGQGQRRDDTFGCGYVVFRWRAFTETGFGYSYSESRVAAGIANGSGNEIIDRGLCYSCAREVTAERRATLPPQEPREAPAVKAPALAAVHADLLALASRAEAEAARYVTDALEADRADAEASAERLRVRARAYRHAAEMLRGVAA